MDYISLSHGRAYSQVSHVSSGQQRASDKRLSSRLMSPQDTKSWAHPAEKARWAAGTNSWFGPGLLPVELMSRRAILAPGEFPQLHIYHANPLGTAHYPNAFNWFGLETSSRGVDLVSTVVANLLFFFSAAGYSSAFCLQPSRSIHCNTATILPWFLSAVKRQMVLKRSSELHKRI